MFLNSRANNKIKHIRHLQQRKTRLLHQQCVIEGSQLMQEALTAGWSLQQVLHLEGLDVQAWSQYNAEIFSCKPDLMEYVSSLNSVPDILGVFSLRLPQENPQRQEAWLLSENIQDPGNFGALLRLADAMNWRGILALGAYPDPFQNKVIRGSMGSCLRLPVQATSLTALRQKQQEGWHLIATAAQSDKNSFHYHFPSKIILALGHEGQGLSDEVFELCQSCVSIPIQQPVDSLNVVTAAAMLVHEYNRQQNQAYATT